MIGTRILVSVFAIVAFGCGTSPYLFGKKSCDDDPAMSAYVVAGGGAAICLPTKRVSFMYCVRELSLLSSNQSDKMSISLDVKDAVGGNAVKDSKLDQLFASEGKLADARADAIQACKQFLN